MLASAFIGRPGPPSGHDLALALGRSKGQWDRVLSALEHDHGAGDRQWKCYSPKSGWSLRVLKKKRVVVYLLPGSKAFLASFALGEKALAAARASRPPPKLVRVLDEAPRYPEGHAVRVEVRTKADADAVLLLAAAKLH
jgi:hypothetical protein